MKLLKSYLLTGLLLLTLASNAWAQPRSFRYWSLGFMAGVMHYQGDLDDHGFQPWIALRNDGSKWGSPLKLFRPGFGVNATYHFHPHMSVTFQASYGWIGAADSNARNSGANKYRVFRNLDFRNRIFEAAAILNYDFFATDRHYRFRPRWSPFIYAGVAVYYNNPFTYIRDKEISGYQNDPLLKGENLEQYRDQRIYLQPLRTEGEGSGINNAPAQYSLVGFAIPLGVGVRWKLSDRVDLRLSFGVRKTFTDHLDDVGSYFYADPKAFLNGGLQTTDPTLSYILSDRSMYRSVENAGTSFPASNNTGFNVQAVDLSRGRQIDEDHGEKRGFPNQQDWYALSGISISYILDPGDRCPKFR